MAPNKKVSKNQNKIDKFLVKNKNISKGRTRGILTNRTNLNHRGNGDQDAQQCENESEPYFSSTASLRRALDDDSDENQPSTSKRALERLADLGGVVNIPSFTQSAREPQRTRDDMQESDSDSESDLALDDSLNEDVEQNPCKRSRMAFELPPPHHIKKGQENTIFLLLRARLYDSPFKYPITYATFKKYIDLDEIADTILKICHNGNSLNYDDCKNDKRCLEQIKKEFYQAFYLYPAMRTRFQWTLNWNTPLTTKKKILSVPPRKRHEFDDYIEQELSLENREVSPIVLDDELDPEAEVQNLSKEVDQPPPSTNQHKEDSRSGTAPTRHSDKKAYFRSRLHNLKEDEMPVSYEDFNKYTNFSEIVDIFMKDKYKEALAERKNTKKHKKFEIFVGKIFYADFYTKPLNRVRWPLHFLHLSEDCAEEKRSIIYNIPEKYRDGSFPSCIVKCHGYTSLHEMFPLDDFDPTLVGLIPVDFEKFKKLAILAPKLDLIVSYLQQCLSKENFEKLKKDNEMESHLKRYYYEHYYLDEDLRSLGSLNFHPCPQFLRDQLKTKPRQILDYHNKYKQSHVTNISNTALYGEEANLDCEIVNESNRCSEDIDVLNNNSENKENSIASCEDKGCSQTQRSDYHAKSYALAENSTEKSRETTLTTGHTTENSEEFPQSLTNSSQVSSTDDKESAQLMPNYLTEAATSTTGLSSHQFTTENVSSENSKQDLLKKLRFYLPLIENFEKYQHLFPVNFQTFKKFAKMEDQVDEVLEKLAQTVPVTDYLGFVDHCDLKNQIYRYIYEQFYMNPLLRSKMNLTFKPAPLNILRKLTSFPHINADSDSQISAVSSTSIEMINRSSQPEILNLFEEKINESPTISKEILRNEASPLNSPRAVIENPVVDPQVIKLVQKSRVPHDVMANYVSLKLTDQSKIEEIVALAVEKMIQHLKVKEHSKESTPQEGTSTSSHQDTLVSSSEELNTTTERETSEISVMNVIDEKQSSKSSGKGQKNVEKSSSLPEQEKVVVGASKDQESGVEKPSSALKTQASLPTQEVVDKTDSRPSVSSNEETTQEPLEKSKKIPQGSSSACEDLSANADSSSDLDTSSTLEETNSFVKSVNEEDSTHDSSNCTPSSISKEVLNEVMATFFKPIAKNNKFPYMLSTSYGLERKIIYIISKMSFQDFLTYVRVYKAEDLFSDSNNKEILKDFYEYAFVTQCGFPLNLYFSLNSLAEFLQAKQISFGKFSLSYIKPNFLHWLDLVEETNFVHLVYLEKFFDYDDGEKLLHDSEDYYQRCWQQNAWIKNKIPAIKNVTLKKFVFSCEEQSATSFNKTCIEKRLKEICLKRSASAAGENCSVNNDVEVICLEISSSEEDTTDIVTSLPDVA